MPCWNPPYGSITAYDLKTGARLWDRPFGKVQHWGFYMPESWGSITIGGPVVTASGLVFIGASMDSRVRALDLATGDVLWTALGRGARGRAAGGLRVQGQAVCGLRRRRQLDPDLAGQRRDRRFRPAGLTRRGSFVDNILPGPLHRAVPWSGNPGEGRVVRGLRRRLTSYGDPDFSLFLRKAFIKAMGFSDDALDRPIVGITNTYSDYNPCHGNVPAARSRRPSAG